MSSKGKISSILEEDDYLTLDKLSLPLSEEVIQKDGSFTLCLWIYFLKSCKSGIAIRQVNTQTKEERPFLTLDIEKKLSLHFWSFRTEETSVEGDVIEETNCLVSAEQPCLTEKWVHIGCEINVDVIRLHMDGVVIGEKHLKGFVENSEPKSIILLGGSGRSTMDDVQGYVHYVHLLPQPTVTNHYVKHPPLELSLDGSTGASDDNEVEEGGDGIWSVVGGKASCRRNFALDVVLLDALGRSVHKDIEIIAILVYADNGVPVEKPKDDAEAPLLTTFDGVEFPSTERPIKLVHGRASFKLKISQLSSKCDNRLFRVCFDSSNVPNYPFLRVFSRNIRCVSRNRNSRAPVAPWKRPNASMFSVETVQSLEEAVMETSLTHNDYVNPSSGLPSKFINGHPPLKRTCAGPVSMFSDQSNESCGVSHGYLTNDVKISPSLEAYKSVNPSNDMARPVKEQWHQSPNSALHPEICSNQERHQDEGTMSKHCDALMLQNHGSHRFGSSDGLSDFLVFKYCLENTSSRAAFLRGAVTCFSDQELSDFANRVSHYTTCQHHRYQICISKHLIKEGNEAWRRISKEDNPVPWDLMISHVEGYFIKLSGSKRRRLSLKDKVFLQQLIKSGELVSHEDFDRLWQWLYPTCLLLSNPQVRSTWEMEDPKWIQGMVFRDEAETLLSGSKPGTFILRFVSACSWPHPDAGGLVVSYVDHDSKLHHKLLCLDKSSGFSSGDRKPLSEVLLSQAELLQPYK